MRRIPFIATLVLFVFGSLQAAEQPKKIVFSYGPHNGEPYVFTHDEAISGGIIWELANKLADELSVEADFVKIPRKRQAAYLEKGITSVILISNPSWLANKDKLLWSKELFIEEDILVTSADNSLTLKSKQDLYGLRLGTIRGYKYPLIDEDLSKKRIIRDDARELTSNLERLLLARIDVLLDSSILIDYRLSEREDRSRFRVFPFTFSSHHIYAAISPKSSVAPEKIKNALEKLKHDGVIDEILRKYK